MRGLLLPIGLLVLSACRGEPPVAPEPSSPAAQAQARRAPTPAPPPAAAEPPSLQTEVLWGDLAKPDDIRRYERLDEAWRSSLEDAGVEHAAELKALGALVDPKAGLPRPHPAPGLYRCRVIKLGSPQGRTLAYVAYQGFRCRVDLTPGGDLTLAKLTGSQRTTGQLHPERDPGGADTDRLVYLGSQAWGSDEPSAPGYGRNEERDQIGVFERIGENRYRLALPWPRQESKLDLLELTPLR